MWSDPTDLNGFFPSSRGCGYQFGPDVLRAFLAYNHLSFIVRSHQLALEGYTEHAKGRCITVWSAPNYLGRRMGNKACVLRLSHYSQPSNGALLDSQTTFTLPPMVRRKLLFFEAASVLGKARGYEPTALTSTCCGDEGGRTREDGGRGNPNDLPHEKPGVDSKVVDAVLRTYFT